MAPQTIFRLIGLRTPRLAQGLGSVGKPCAQAQGKCCCFTGTVEYDFTSDIMGGGGLCFSGGKCCCCVQAMQFPPKKLFIEIVGMRVVGGPKPGAAGFGNKSELEMVTVDSEIEVLNRELQEAIAAEDFIRAAVRNDPSPRRSFKKSTSPRDHWDHARPT